MLHRDHCRVHAHRHRTRCFVKLGDAQQLDCITQALCNCDVGCRDLGDAFAIHVARNNIATKCDTRDNRNFRRSVQTLDIGCRVTFCITKLLRASQCVFVTRAVFAHLGENVICCSIDNAEHSPDWLAAQTFAQWTNKWNTSAHCSLKQQVDACIVGRRKQLCTMSRDQRLVGSDYRLATC